MSRFPFILLVGCLLAVATRGDTAPPTGKSRLRIERQGGVRRVRVVLKLGQAITPALPKGKVRSELGRQHLQLSLLDGKAKRLPPMFGRYERRGDELTFVPRFPLAPGSTYRAAALRHGSVAETTDYRVPRSTKGPASEVTRVYPGGEKLPANLLKFYIHFSQPMREGLEIFDQIQLLDSDNRPIIAPWRRVELWSRDSKRLTLWIHPGRVKRGVNLREEEGPVLRPGRRYSLVMTRRMRGANDQPLAKRFVKRFRTFAEDHDRPLPQHWKTELPKVGTREPLTLRFREPLDHALLQRMIRIEFMGRRQTGRVRVHPGEGAWSFVPQSSWRGDDYRIVADGLLEDRAGNTPLRVFDDDRSRRGAPAPRLMLPFRPLRP